jgi:hypothetical protein
VAIKIGRRVLSCICGALLPALAWCSVAAAAPAVTNVEDSGPGSLRAAITAASPGDTIAVPAGTYILASAIAITVNVHLVGAGPSTTVIIGNGSRIFSMSSALSISGLALTDGLVQLAPGAADSGGGAIFDKGGALTISNSLFSADSVESGGEPTELDGGGAVYVDGAPATISTTTFADNTAQAEAGTHDGGGAIFTQGSGTLALIGDSFTGDRFSKTGGGEFDGGGGVYAANGAVTVTDTMFNGESVSLEGGEKGAFAFTGGGAIWGGGGVSVFASTISANAVNETHGSFETGGGGIFSYAGALSVTGSTVNSNVANLGLRAMISNGGGGIYNAGTTLAILNSTFSGNVVNASGPPTEAGGGALYDFGTGGTITGTTIAGNSVAFPGAGAYGGGIYRVSETPVGALALHDTILAANTLSGAFTEGTNCSAPNTSPIASTGYNLEDANSCGLTATGDLVNADPLLGALAANGGPTMTRALALGSPAIHAGGPCAPVTADQRGLPRASPCTIGAFEPQAPAATTAPEISGSAIAGQILRCTAGSWSGDGSLAFTYHWLSGGVALVGAVNREYAVLLRDAGHGLSCLVTATGPGGSASLASNTLTAALPPKPGILSVRQSVSRWRLGNRLPALSATRRPPLGTTFSIALSEAATLRIVFTHSLPGRRRGRRCVTQTHANRRGRACKRVATVGAITANGRAATNKLIFQGRVSPTVKLKPGRYSAVITASDAFGQRSAPQSLTFTVLHP